MFNFLRQNTAVTVTLGPFEHFLPASGSTRTLVSGLVLAGTTCGLVKSNTGTSTSLGGNNFAQVTGVSGYYQLGLTAGNTDTTGPLFVFVSGSTGGSMSCLDVRETFQVVTQNFYDGMHGDASLQVSATTFGATGVSDSGVTVNRINSGVTLASGVSVTQLGATSVSDSGVTVQSLTTTAEADVKSQVTAALYTDTYGEPAQGAPSATTSIIGKISYLYKAWRNKMTNDGTYIKLFADDTTTCDQKAAVTESGGTVTRSEYITGA